MADQPVNPVIVDLQNYIAQMPPYQKEREGGQLLIRSKEEIERLLKQLATDSQTICRLQRELVGADAMVEALEFYQRYWHQGPSKADWALKKYREAKKS